MAVCVASVASFLTPVATPANLMVMEPGGYRFGDYWKLGLPLLALFGVVAVVFVPLIWCSEPAAHAGRASVLGQPHSHEEDVMTTLRDDEILTFATTSSRLEVEADADGDDSDADDADADADDTDADADDSDADADDTDGS
jgi:hypothetical protein